MQLIKATAILATCLSTVYADTVWLANCGSSSSTATTPEMVYSATGTLNGLPGPGDTGVLIGPGPKNWEGQTLIGSFGNVIFKSQINTGANSLPVGGFAGTGSNQFNSYTCHRDDQELLYQEVFSSTNQYQCFKEYYCLSN
jgi:hypothetical protein